MDQRYFLLCLSLSILDYGVLMAMLYSISTRLSRCHLEHIYLIVYYAEEIAENISVFSSHALSVRPALTRSIYQPGEFGDTKPRLHTVRMDSSPLLFAWSDHRVCVCVCVFF